MSRRPILSVVIPAYNEEARLEPTLERVRAWLDEQALSGEVVVVDDGSADRTAALARRHAAVDPRIRVVENGVNRGKGFSVRHGIGRALGERILISDADLSTPIDEYHKLADALGAADIAIGSRALPDSDLQKRQPIYRELMGRTFNLLVQGLVFPGIHDTQCGFKLFRAPIARQIFGLCRIDGFAFDVEALFVARRLGFRVAEVPVVWIDDAASRVDPVKHSIQMLSDILRIRRLHRDLGS